MMADGSRPADVVDATAARLQRAAVAYAEHFACHVFPLHGLTAERACTCRLADRCGSPGKHPRAAKGWRQASSDPAAVREMWDRWPGAHVGLALSESGVVVLDVEPRTGGSRSLAALEAKHGRLPAAPVSLTGGGGRHYLFLRPASQEVLRGRPIADGLVVKADEAFVVLPPSAHASGTVYRWSPDAHIRDIALSEAPGWLVAALDRGARAGPRGVIDGLVGAAFEAAGWLGRPLGQGKTSARCPWEDEHDAGARLDGTTLVFAPAAGEAVGTFSCAAASCQRRSLRDVLDRIPAEALRAARTRIGADPAWEPAPPPGPGGAPTPAAPPTSGGWERGLRFNDKGTLAKDVGNAALILQHAPEWRGVLGFNDFAARIEFLRPGPDLDGFRPPPPGPMADSHAVYVQHWLSKRRGVAFGKQLTIDAIEQAAHAHSFSPVRDYLSRVRWDGQRRLDRWLSVYLGAEANDYTSAVGRWWLLSAVARAFQPGEQADHVAVLEGPQGAGKSSAIRILAVDRSWCLGSLPGLSNDKEAMERIHGAWLVEIAELDAVRGASLERVKSFVSQVTDAFRPAYGRFKVQHPRACVFVGTTNDSTYLHDPTGARRFWPVQIRELHRDELERDRDALWAEAVQRREDGARWYPAAEDGALLDAIRREQEARFDVDPWEELIETWLGGQTITSTNEVMEFALKLEPRDRTRFARDRVVDALRRLGWRSSVAWDDGRSTRRWVREG